MACFHSGKHGQRNSSGCTELAAAGRAGWRPARRAPASRSELRAAGREGTLADRRAASPGARSQVVVLAQHGDSEGRAGDLAELQDHNPQQFYRDAIITNPPAAHRERLHKVGLPAHGVRVVRHHRGRPEKMYTSRRSSATPGSGNQKQFIAMLLSLLLVQHIFQNYLGRLHIKPQTSAPAGRNSCRSGQHGEAFSCLVWFQCRHHRQR